MTLKLSFLAAAVCLSSAGLVAGARPAAAHGRYPGHPTTRPTRPAPPTTTPPATTPPTTAPGTPVPATPPATSTQQAGTAALSAINADRATASAAPLVANTALVTKAQQWARHLAEGSGGVCSMTTLVHSSLADGAPAGWRALGENVGCRTASGALGSFVAPMETGFMNSPGHRANILDTTFNVGGVGFATVTTGNGQLLVFEVQEFARV